MIAENSIHSIYTSQHSNTIYARSEKRENQMNTQEIIIEMEKIPPEERQVVIQHFEREGEEKYSKEVIAELIERKKEAEREDDIVGPFQGKEAVEYLRRLRQA